jgi:tellurite resistance protein TerC
MVFKTARRVVIAVIGGTVALIGVAMIVLPGPAIVVIPAGLAILGTEFAWAKRLLKRLKQQAASMFPGKGTPGATPAPAPDSQS